MTTFDDVAIKSLLNKVSYDAKYINKGNVDNPFSKLLEHGYSQQEVAFLNSNYKCLENSHTASGLDIAIFENNTTKETTMAIAGTDKYSPADHGSDYQIYTNGMPTDQFIDLYNFTQQYQASSDGSYKKIVEVTYDQLNPNEEYLWVGSTDVHLPTDKYYKVETVNDGSGLGLNISDYTGHSLGGPLAALMASLYDKSAIIFNAPGLSDDVGGDYNTRYVDENGNVIPMTSDIGAFLENLLKSGLDLSNIEHIYNTNGPNWVINVGDGYPKTIGVPCPTAINSHGIDNLTAYFYMLNNIYVCEGVPCPYPPVIPPKYTPILPMLPQSPLTGDEIKDIIEDLSDGQCKPTIIPNTNTPQNITTALKENKETAEVTPSPLIVDLDGDGVETTGTQSGTHFDHDSNGFAENTGWVGKDDGILVRDINGNGEIDNGTELFGNNSVLSNGEKAANGFEALKDLDSNKDGIFNNADTAWNEVKVWKDSNGNGIVDDGELLTLEQAGIAGVNLGYNNQNITDANGNQHAQTGTFIKTDGTSGTVSDVWFDDDKMNTVDKTDVVIPDAVKALPDIEGFGNVHSLQVAMALDETGELKALVEQYAAETDPEARDAILINLIYHWTGVQDMDPEGRNPTQVYGNVLGDSRKLEALEEFWGKEFLGTWCWGERDPNPHGKAAPYILQAFDDLKDYIKNQLNAQTHYKDMLEAVTLTYNETTQTWEADVSAAIDMLRSIYSENTANGFTALKEFSAIVAGYESFSAQINEAFKSFGNAEGNTFEKDLLIFGHINNTATAGNDTLNGTTENDYINGKEGNDRIYGGDGDDVLIGGAGDDYLVGGNGNDRYRFEAGFGNDSLDNSQDGTEANQDVVEFGEDILKENVTMDRQGYDLIIKVSYPPAEGETTTHPDDTLRIFSYFDKQGTTSATVSQIKFADGTIWNYEYVISNWNSMPSAGGGIIVEGGNGNDTLSGTNYDDILIGNDGDDNMYGYSGNDIFIGGKGNDTLRGREGNDTYIWNLGDGMDVISDNAGHDKIVFGEGITFEDLTFEAIPNQGYGYKCVGLKIYVKGDVNQGILIDAYFASPDNRVEELKFVDGSSVRLSEIPLILHQNSTVGQNIVMTDNGDTIYAGSGNDIIAGGKGDDTIYGGDGNDSIGGVEGNDTFIGGKGNDYIDGGYGDDTYIWNWGDDFDTISDGAGYDKIVFGEGISFEDLSFEALPNQGHGYQCVDLKISVKGDPTQGIIINAYFANQNYRIEELKFSDDRSVRLSEIPLILHQNSTNDQTIGLTNNGDTLYAGSGNDTIAGGKGDDTIYGGDGNDSINGNDGNDIIYGGNGNDYIAGGNGNDIVFAGDGDDTIYGNGGDNIISGDKGNDSINCSSGNDTYLWNLGDGLDSICDNGGNDKIVFGEGISHSDLSFSKNRNDLKIIIKGDETQGMNIENFYNHEMWQVETAEFADGSTLDLTNADLLVQAMSTFGADGSNGMDTLSSDPTSSVHEMYSLACSSDLSKKAA